jgi:hypothetical protein
MWKKTKLGALVEYMKNQEWEKALQLASTFHDLGKHENAIKRAQQAIKNPRFAKQIGVFPEVALQEGIKALKEKYWKYLDYDEYIDKVIKEKQKAAKAKEKKRKATPMKNKASKLKKK